jgi:hypothetical protein
MKLFFSKQHDVYEFGSGPDSVTTLALVIVYQLPDLKKFRIIYHANQAGE